MVAAIFIVTFGQTYAKIDIGERILAFILPCKCISDGRVGNAQAIKGAIVLEISSVGPRPYALPNSGANFHVKSFFLMSKREFLTVDASSEPMQSLTPALVRTLLIQRDAGQS